jgi:hypothetical protein
VKTLTNGTNHVYSVAFEDNREALTTGGDSAMATRVTGPFNVKMNPQSEDKAAGSALGWLSLDDLDYTLPSPS